MGEKFNNIWDALFDDPAEKAVCEAKSVLVDEVRNYITHNKLTQSQAAEVMGVTQPRISDLTRGKISKFTVDALLGMLAKVNIETSISFKENGVVPIHRLPWNGFEVVEGRRKEKNWKTRSSYSHSVPVIRQKNEEEYVFPLRA